MVNRTPSSVLGADILRLFSGAAFGQIAFYAATPIIVRLFAPEAFGELAIFLAISGTLGMVSCLRYELAIALPDSDQDAACLLALSVLVACLTAAVGAVIAAAGAVLGLGATPNTTWFILMIPLSAAGAGLSLALGYWSARCKRYTLLAGSRFANRFGCAAMQVGAGVLGLTSSQGLIFPAVCGQLLATALLLVRTMRVDGPHLQSAVTPQRVRQCIVRYRRFPLFNTWAGLLNHFAWQLPTLLLAVFYSTTVVGYYALADMVLRTPLSLLGGAVSQVFYQRVATLVQDRDRLAVAVGQLHARLVRFSLAPLAIIAVSAPSLFGFCFGEGWQAAGLYSRPLAIWAFFWFTSSPLSQLFDALERHQTTLAVNTLVFCTRAIALVIGGWFFDDAFATVTLLATASATAYAGFGALLLTTAGVDWRTTGSQLRRAVLPAVTTTAPVAVLVSVSAPGGLILLGAVACLVGHAVWLLHDDHAARATLIGTLARRHTNTSPPTTVAA